MFHKRWQSHIDYVNRWGSVPEKQALRARMREINMEVAHHMVLSELLTHEETHK